MWRTRDCALRLRRDGGFPDECTRPTGDLCDVQGLRGDAVTHCDAFAYLAHAPHASLYRNVRHSASHRHTPSHPECDKPGNSPDSHGVTDSTVSINMSGTYSQRVDRYMAHGMGYMEACAKVTAENKARLAA